MRNMVVPVLGVVTNVVGCGELKWCEECCDCVEPRRREECGVRCRASMSVRNVLGCAEAQQCGECCGQCRSSAVITILWLVPSISAVTNVVGCAKPQHCHKCCGLVLRLSTMIGVMGGVAPQCPYI